MKYIYISAGRKFWHELAIELKRSHGHEPVLWYGDQCLLPLFKKSFEQCLFVETEPPRPIRIGKTLAQVLKSTEFHWIKDEAIKMLDRIDSHDLWGRKVRETFFYRNLITACELIDTTQADFLLLSESPHDVFSYLIWRISRISGMPCFHFEAASIAPGLIMVSADSDHLKKIPRAREIDEPELKTILQCADDYIQRFKAGAQPGYMIAQKAKEITHKRFWRNLGDALLRFYPLPLLLKQRLHNRNKGKSSLAASRLRLWGREKTDQLRRAYTNKGQSDFLGRDFIYFPLHYEPERTTSPDGGIYYDQIRTILDLRAKLPESFLLVIKEHPSQLYKTMRGFKGREAGVYDLLETIEGITLASPEITSAKLISHCRGLVTITGTAALESVLSGKPALILGNAWFQGIPGAFAKDQFAEFYGACLEADSRSNEPAHRWLIRYLSEYAFIGCVNPSNEKYFSSYRDLLNTQNASQLAYQINKMLSPGSPHSPDIISPDIAVSE